MFNGDDAMTCVEMIARQAFCVTMCNIDSEF